MRTAICCALSLALAGPRPVQDSIEVRAVSAPGHDRPDIELEWKAPFLPDGATLSIQVTRLEERHKDGAIERQNGFTATGQGYAKGGVFSWKGPAAGPGMFRTVVVLSADYQGARALQALKDAKVVMPQKWTNECIALDADLAARLGPSLQEMNKMLGAAADLVRRLKEASASRNTWRDRSRGLLEEAPKLREDFNRMGARRYFSASSTRLSNAIDLLTAAGRCIHFDRHGNLAGFVQHENPSDPILKFEGEIFSWELLLKRLEDMKETAGREFCLWAVLAMRRGPVDAMVRAVRDYARHPGIAPFAERIQGGGKLDELEADIRRRPK